jgi:hypothetical protein
MEFIRKNDRISASTKKQILAHGGTQPTPHSPQEQETRVRIQPGHKVLLRSQRNALKFYLRQRKSFRFKI